eukprot:COSAG02_NODE_12011_length_1613_cov_5.487150_1_plen_82_part_10
MTTGRASSCAAYLTQSHNPPASQVCRRLSTRYCIFALFRVQHCQDGRTYHAPKPPLPLFTAALSNPTREPSRTSECEWVRCA